MLEVTLENYETVRIEAEDLAFSVDADGDLQIDINGECIAYYPSMQWRRIVNMKVEDTKTIAGPEITYKIAGLLESE